MPPTLPAAGGAGSRAGRDAASTEWVGRLARRRDLHRQAARGALIGKLRALGHEPVALLAPRSSSGPPPPRSWSSPTRPCRTGSTSLCPRRVRDRTAPPFLCPRPDALLGLPVEDPQAALDVPRLGSIDLHPALLPRHRGPIRSPGRCATATLSGGRRGTAWTRSSTRATCSCRGRCRSRTTMSTSRSSAPSCGRARSSCLPRALERVAAGDPGRPAAHGGRDWAGHFEDDDYVRIDWSHPARSIHNQVRAWRLTFGMSGLRAPIAELDGEEVVVLQTRLTDPGGGARRVDAATGRSGSSRPSPSRRSGDSVRGFSRRTRRPGRALVRELAAIAQLRLLAHQRLQLLDHVARLADETAATSRSSRR